MSQDEIPMIRLTTGEELPRAAAGVVFGGLQDLLDENPFALADLFLACTKEEHAFHPGSDAFLAGRELLSVSPEGTVTIPAIVRGLVAASVQLNPETMTVKMVSPFEED